MLPRFFAPDAAAPGARVRLPPDESHHAARVLRLREGDEVALFDGRGHEWQGRIAAAAKNGMTIDVLRALAPVREPRIPIVLVQSVLKGDHMDAVVRDATMAGVVAIVPALAARTVAPGAAGAKARDRWQRVVLASAKQCRRAVLPDLAAAAPLAAVLDAPEVDRPARIVLAEPTAGTDAVTPRELAAPASAVVVVGPEGGWDPGELEMLGARGYVPLTLGPLTLRADAAALVAISMLRATWNDF